MSDAGVPLRHIQSIVQADFEIRGQQVWLSETGKRKFVELYERRKQETWKHPITGYSLTYRRLMELSVLT